MNELLTTILKNITTKPDAVEISMETEGDVDVYTIKVDPEDVGRVIGKSGKVIRAIRSLAHVSAVQQQKRVRIHLDDGGPQEETAPQADINQAATAVQQPVVGEVQPEVVTTPEVAPEQTAQDVAPEVVATPEIAADPVAPVEPEVAPEVTPEASVEEVKVEAAQPAVEDLLPEEPAK